MKAKTNSAKKKPSTHPVGIPDAYDLRKARDECRACKYRTREALAWMRGGWLQHSLTLDFAQAEEEQRDAAHLLQKWLEPLGSIGNISEAVAPPGSSTRPQCVKCLVWATGGSGWLVWEEDAVKTALFKAQGSPGPGLSFTSIEDSIFDMMNAEFVWLRSYETPSTDRCSQFAKHLLTLIANNAVVARSAVPGFWSAFESDTYNSPYGPGEGLAELLNRCKDAATKMIRSFHFKALLNEEADAGTAIQVSFRLGGWLTEAKNLITNEQGKGLVTHSGNHRRGRAPLWAWLASEPAFEGMSAKKVFPLLHGRTDPEFPDTCLHVKDDLLIRGDGKQVRENSFASSWRSLQARKKKPSAS